MAAIAVRCSTSPTRSRSRREEVEAQKSTSWWYSKASGGGSLLDYLGYGTTLGTWFMNGEAPIEVTSVVDETPGIEVDQHSITVCRYARGLSKFETRWGTLTDPWTQQPQPKCGFVLVGSDGSISSYDYDDFVTLQTRKRPTPIASAGGRAAGRPARADRIHAGAASRTARRSPARSTRRSASSAKGSSTAPCFRPRASGRSRSCHEAAAGHAEAERRRRPKGDRSKTLPKKQDGGRGRAALGYAKPRTYEELRAVLSSGTIHFPKRLRQVAIFLWQHPGDVALGTIVPGGRAGRRAALDAGPLRADFRLCRLLGFPGAVQGTRQGILARDGRGTAARKPARKQRQSAFHERLDRRFADLARPHRRQSSTSTASSG